MCSRAKRTSFLVCYFTYLLNSHWPGIVLTLYLGPISFCLSSLSRVYSLKLKMQKLNSHHCHYIVHMWCGSLKIWTENLEAVTICINMDSMAAVTFNKCVIHQISKLLLWWTNCIYNIQGVMENLHQYFCATSSSHRLWVQV